MTHFLIATFMDPIKKLLRGVFIVSLLFSHVYFFRNLILTIIFISALFSCNWEKKTENGTISAEIEPLAKLAKSRYTMGDSIAVRFSEAVSNVSVSLDGKPILKGMGSKDSLLFASASERAGWHQVVVAGMSSKKNSFSDTMALELLSDVLPREIGYTVLGQFPHSKSSFTQGLEFYKDELYEGTGEHGKSQLMKVDLKTGNALKSISLDKQYFGEGITIVNDKIYQLTWQSGICFRYNMDFTLDKTFTYYFQGWGLTHKDSTLVMSDGSNRIHFYDTNFEKIGDIEVYDNKGPVRKLNELEYVNGYLYANIFETTKIVKIDLKTGKVVGFINMDGIVPAGTDARRDVLNGIAFKVGEDAFYVTGKNWPLMFKVRLNESKVSKQANL